MTDFKITFDVGYPYLSSLLNTKRSINSSIIDTFLHILSQTPDSLIIRKSGLENANYVSRRAREILKVGGSSSQRGLDMLLVLDEELHSKGGDLNPGTTADLTSASIFVTLLEGWRP